MAYGVTREIFSQIHSATKMEILFLKLFAILVQWNDLSVLSHRFDRGPTALLRGSFPVESISVMMLMKVSPAKDFFCG
jgi:hypothetical protein